MTEAVVKKEKKQHARYSPSTLDGLKKCLRFKFDRTKSMDEAADEGTMLHYAMETEDLTGLDEHQMMDVTQALEYVKGLEMGLSKNIVVLKEPRLILFDLTFGNSDRVTIDIDNQVAHVMDYKFVRTEGDHEFQTRTYGAAVVEMLHPEHGILLKNGDLLVLPIKRVFTHIIAPRLQKIEVNEYDGEQLLTEVRTDIESLYARIDDPWMREDASTPELCARCARCAVCPSVNKTIQLAAPIMGLPMPEQFAPDAIVSLADRSIAQKLKPLFEKWAEQVGRNNTAFVVAGGEIPGFKLTTRNNGFSVPRESTLTAVTILKSVHNMTDDQLYSAMKISVPELSEVMAQTSVDKADAWKAKITESLLGIGKSGTSQYLSKLGKGK